MQLIEIEPYFWELYEDSENIYLNRSLAKVIIENLSGLPMQLLS